MPEPRQNFCTQEWVIIAHRACQAPRTVDRAPAAAAWYLSIIPRLTRVAGFELGSGMVHQYGASGGCGRVPVQM